MKLNNFHLIGIIVLVLLIGGLGFLANEGYQNVTKPKTEFLCRAIPTETPRDVQMAYYAKSNEMANVHPGLINQPVTEGFIEGLTNPEKSKRMKIKFANDAEEHAFWSIYPKHTKAEKGELIRVAKKLVGDPSSFKQNDAVDFWQKYKLCKSPGCDRKDMLKLIDDAGSYAYGDSQNATPTRHIPESGPVGSQPNPQNGNNQVLTKSSAVDLKDPITKKKSTYHCAGVGPKVDTRCLRSSNESLPPINEERVCNNSLEGQRRKDALTCNNIPEGKEHLYVLKTSIVPPVCPKCPECPSINCPVCDKKKKNKDSEVEDDMEENKLSSEKAMEDQKENQPAANRGMNQQNSYYSNKGRDHKREQSNNGPGNNGPNETALSSRTNEPMGLLNSFFIA